MTCIVVFCPASSAVAARPSQERFVIIAVVKILRSNSLSPPDLVKIVHYHGPSHTCTHARICAHTHVCTHSCHAYILMTLDCCGVFCPACCFCVAAHNLPSSRTATSICRVVFLVCCIFFGAAASCSPPSTMWIGLGGQKQSNVLVIVAHCSTITSMLSLIVMLHRC